MTRILLLVAGLGALTSVVCFAVAYAFGGPEWEGPWCWRRCAPAIAGDGPQVTRAMAWTGGDTLSVGVAADVDYTQAPEAKMTVVGPSGTVNNLKLEAGRLSYSRRMRRPPRMKISVTAPGVSTFKLAGFPTLKIEGYDRPSLAIATAGIGAVSAAGRTGRLELKIAGPASADLGALAAGDADVKIAGPGKATIAATGVVSVFVAGPGEVTLTTHPAKLNSRVAGPGRIIEAPEAAAPKS